jgi:hypothetical protein
VLVQDLLRRERESPGITPMHLVEVFTKPGLDMQEVRQYIIEKTGMCPAIYDNGTHYATNQKLTIEMLEEISDSDDVLEAQVNSPAVLGAMVHLTSIEEDERRSDPQQQQQHPQLRLNTLLHKAIRKQTRQERGDPTLESQPM